MCRNWKLWIGLGLGAVVLAVAMPGLRPVLPILLIAACPLMMLVMIGGVALAARHRPSAPDDSDGDGRELERLRAEIDRLRAGIQR